MDQINIPRAQIIQLIKTLLPANFQVTKGSTDYVVKACRVFIHYLITFAMEKAKEDNRETVNETDLLAAIEDFDTQNIFKSKLANFITILNNNDNNSNNNNNNINENKSSVINNDVNNNQNNAQNQLNSKKDKNDENNNENNNENKNNENKNKKKNLKLQKQIDEFFSNNENLSINQSGLNSILSWSEKKLAHNIVDKLVSIYIQTVNLNQIEEICNKLINLFNVIQEPKESHFYRLSIVTFARAQMCFKNYQIVEQIFINWLTELETLVGNSHPMYAVCVKELCESKLQIVTLKLREREITHFNFKQELDSLINLIKISYSNLCTNLSIFENDTLDSLLTYCEILIANDQCEQAYENLLLCYKSLDKNYLPSNLKLPTIKISETDRFKWIQKENKFYEFIPIDKCAEMQDEYVQFRKMMLQTCLLRLGVCAINLDNSKSAISHFQNAILQSQHVPINSALHINKFMIFETIINSFIQKNDFENTLNFLNQGIEIASKELPKDHSYLIQWIDFRTQIAETICSNQQIHKYYLESLESFESLFTQNSKIYIRKLFFYVQFLNSKNSNSLQWENKLTHLLEKNNFTVTELLEPNE
eukprot:TRINITY_DN2568_c0_g3_i2.p1 TRINITY_DN2568_c0_g3~~TRINITY_DN2568_c0_g3_i2.p1  ORF type:complete len:593 (+),score=234.87 TRINITY_DN2568_c0_g3_i2:140-1918(+)